MHPNPDQSRTGGNDAVCFTAGPKGAIFGIGLIHAWLAADRTPPEVAAGISTGALTAAAMQYSYRELEKESSSDLEVRRWAWFRKYLANVSDAPLDVIWRAIPDPVDFFTDKPPVADWSRPEPLKHEEAAARRHYYMLTKLGVWLGGLPIQLSTIATAAITYVRFKERYGLWLWMLLVNLLTVGRIGLQLLYHLCFSPFFSERTFHIPRERASLAGRALEYLWSWRFRPLFGWMIWTGAVCAILLLTAGAAMAAAELALHVWRPLPWALRDYIAVAIGPLTLLVLIAAVSVTSARDALVAQVLHGLGIPRGVLHDYELYRRLLGLFTLDPANPEEPKLEEKPFQLVLVATALQNVCWKGKKLRSQQVWAETGTRLTQAICAALCVTGVFAPLRLSKREDIKCWVDPDGMEHLDLVDGAGISQNPLPALFGWLKDDSCRGRLALAEKLYGRDRNDKRVHVVYSVPIEPYRPENSARPETINIVESAFISRELERRRDTRQEARQTNFLSELELYVRAGGNQTCVLPIFADEIAPEQDIVFTNNLAPTPPEIRTVAAAACRRTLEALYREDLRRTPVSPTPCHQLLSRIAPRRGHHISPECPGVREICSACTRQLYYRVEPEGPPPPGVKSTFGRAKSSAPLAATFRHLNRERPRIVFLGSGGVFRGSFHAGVVAAMHALEIRPDLVIGASVGALMGGALCAISVLDERQGRLLLRDLCNTFLCVDRQVALTRTLKNVAKQLGTRARRIRLSPAELARMIRRGGRLDAGFAAVGAPPALIDAISDLFLIPRGRTRSIASEFVAGHITAALKRFWQQVQRETLPSFDIETFLMGTSLLDPLARRLLGEKYGIPLTNSQPYHHARHPISFFCTTSDFYERRSLLLGRDFLCEYDFLRTEGSYDFVNAALCSSAFPMVFAPRAEAQLLPGRGRTDVLLADGGMFDNLPFFPAIEVLSEIQEEHRRIERPGRFGSDGRTEALQFLRTRQLQPDLIIAAALDPDAGSVQPGDLDTFSAVMHRVHSLEKNVKSRSFADTSERVGVQTELLLKNPPRVSDEKFIKFVDSVVPAGVLQVIPTDKEHVNGTFAFCRSAGMQQDRVRRSIADGCFQTLRAIAKAQRSEDKFPVLERSVAALSDAGRIPQLAAVKKRRDTPPEMCPFFDVYRHTPGKDRCPGWGPVACPFEAAADGAPAVPGIRDVCAKDKEHHRLISLS